MNSLLSESNKKRWIQLKQRILINESVRRTLKWLDIAGGFAIRTSIGARLVGALLPKSRPVLCEACFNDEGLRRDAARVGIEHALPCPNCGKRESKKLTPYLTKMLVGQFFVRGSVLRAKFGSAPALQFNEFKYRKGDYQGPPWLESDVKLVSEKAKIGIFHYGPRMWMIGHVTPLEHLEDPKKRDVIVDRILNEYPTRVWQRTESFYRLRVNPTRPDDPAEYDSPPNQFLGNGRLDSPGMPVMYCSQDIEGCAHECRVTVEDELYLATIHPMRDLKLLDLTELLIEEHVTEFESLDMAVHMLFYAGKHAYPISQHLAIKAKSAGFDGLIYPSFFGQVRSGRMPFETVYGISVRRFPGAAEREKHGVFPNLALFDRPLLDGHVQVVGINRLILHKVGYDLHFGPVRQVTTT